MRKKLLFVSDCLETCSDLIEEMMDRFEVKCCQDGAEALLYLRTETPPELVIVDPEIEGLADWELVRYLHSSKACRGIPIIIISEHKHQNHHHHTRHQKQKHIIIIKNIGS